MIGLDYAKDNDQCYATVRWLWKAGKGHSEELVRLASEESIALVSSATVRLPIVYVAVQLDDVQAARKLSSWLVLIAKNKRILSMRFSNTNVASKVVAGARAPNLYLQLGFALCFETTGNEPLSSLPDETLAVKYALDASKSELGGGRKRRVEEAEEEDEEEEEDGADEDDEEEEAVGVYPRVTLRRATQSERNDIELMIKYLKSMYLSW